MQMRRPRGEVIEDEESEQEEKGESEVDKE